MISVVIPHYNSSDVLMTTVEKVLESSSREGIHVEILIADDGSSEPHRSSIRGLAAHNVRIVLSERNLGRSGAVNLGVAEAHHDLILILDCDCRPGSDRFLSTHLQAIANADISLGGLLKLAEDFWGRYQDLAVERRVRQYTAGMPFSFTTQNVLIRRHVFQSISGYDEKYTRYGFEDRDLLIRLQEAGARFGYLPGASVVHCDTRISLTSVVSKMRDAGRYTSALFRARHPAAYRSLGYSRLDANLHPSLRLVGRHAGTVAKWLALQIDPWLNSVPFPLGVTVARTLAALAYLGGTAEAMEAGNPD